MNIHSAISSMKLQEFDKLLSTPATIVYPNRALSQPKISWKAYSGSITLDELPKMLLETFERNFSTISKNQPFERKYSQQFEQIKMFRVVKEKVINISNKVQRLWKKETLGKLGAFFQASDPSKELEAMSQELDRVEKRLKIDLSQQRAYAAQKKAEEERFQSTFFNGHSSHPFFSNLFFGNSFFGNGFTAHSMPFFLEPEIPTPKVDPYKVMNLPRDASPQEIKKQYHKLALKLHPDKNINNVKANEKFQELNSAYEFFKKKFHIT